MSIKSLCNTLLEFNNVLHELKLTNVNKPDKV